MKNMKIKWKGTKAGFVDDKGTWLIAPIYDNAHPFQEGLAAVEINGDWGFIDSDGNFVIKPQFQNVGDFINGLAIVDGKFINNYGKFLPKLHRYDRTRPFSEGLAWVANDGEGFIDLQGNPVIDTTFKDASDFNEGLSAVRKISKKAHIPSTKFGYIDYAGNWKIDPIYEKARGFKDGLAAVMITAGENNLWGFINPNGDYVITPQFFDTTDFHNGIAAVNYRYNWGLIDKKGAWIFKPQSNKILYSFNGIFLVKVKNHNSEKWGGISNDGKWVISPIYDNIDFDPFNKVFFAKENGKTGIMNAEGEWLLQPYYDEIYEISSKESKKFDLYEVDLKGKRGIIDISDLSVVCKPQFSNICNVCGGIIEVMKGKKHGLLDREGNVLVAPKYSAFEALYFNNDGLLLVKKGKKYGYINRDGVEIIAPEYEDIKPHKNGIYTVYKEFYKRGFIDSEGKIIAQPEFIDVQDFSEEGIGAVKLNEKWGLVNRSGDLVGGKFFEDVKRFQFGAAPIKDGDKWYFVNADGNRITPLEFEYAQPFYKGVAVVWNNNLAGLIDKSGNIIFDFNAEQIESFEKDEIAMVKIDGKYGFVNINGEFVYKPIYDSFTRFYNGFLRLKLDGKYGLADKNGGWDIEPIIDEHENDYYSLTGTHYIYGPARVGDKWGFINHNNAAKVKWMIPPRFDRIKKAPKGEGDKCYQVWENNKIGMVNKKRGIIIEPQKVEDIGIFYDDGDEGYFFRAKVNGKWGVMDSDGEWIVDPQFDNIGGTIDGRFNSTLTTTVEKNDKKGYIKWNGKITIPPIYDEVYELVKRIARVRVGEKYGFVDIDGNIIAQPIYDQAEDFLWASRARVMRGLKVMYLNEQGQEIQE